MCTNIFTVEIMAIVCRNKRYGKPLAHIKKGLVHIFLFIYTVVLNLKEKVVLSEDFKIKARGFISMICSALLDPSGDFTPKTS